MLYTAIPLEWIMEEEECAPPKKRRELAVNGCRLLVEQTNEDTYEIVQIISSEPSHYLNARYQPGQSIQLKPLL